MRQSIALVLWLLPCVLVCGQPEDYAQAESLVRRTVKELSPPADAVFDFTETRRRLGHLSRPWQTWQRDVAGTFLLADDASSFYQADSTKAGRGVYSSFKFCCDTTLAIINYGENEPQKLTLADREEFLYDLSSLTPVFLLKDFLSSDMEKRFIRYVPGAVDSVVYRSDAGKIISLAIDPGTQELRGVSVLYSHEMYGDVVRRVTFTEYASSDAGDFRYPSRIVESELGFDARIVSIALSQGSFDRSRILAMIPPTYRLQPDPPKSAESITRSDYNEHIHLLDLPHTDAQALVVEFKEYLLVAEAPLNTRNGEMIIREAEKIAPGKPVRYFLFGHHHPHYLGGIRAFVHRGSTVLTTPLDTAYLHQLVSFSHLLEPDSLAIDPRPLKLELIDGQRSISDGDLEMRIIHIGTMSKHTEDYLIYYFPKYRLLFQGDLVWIPKDKPLTAASERQKGLYDAIRLHGLDVETIIQSWPVNEYGVKSVFGFKELERSVEMIEVKK